MIRTIFSIIVLFMLTSARPPVKTVDVLVFGGTTGGTSAGIQAARLGSKTLIVEETHWLGGMLTAAGVSCVDGNHHLPSGMWNEFRDLLRKRYGGADALATGWVSATSFEPHVGDSIFKAMANREANLEIVYGYHLVSVQRNGDQVIGATFQKGNGEKLTVKAKVTVDATDLGDGLAMAGAEYRLGMDSKSETGEEIALFEKNDVVQDLTWVAILKDYGKDMDMTIPKPSGYNPDVFKGCCESTVDGNAIDCDKMLTYGKLPNNKYMINWPKKGNDVYLNVVEMNREQRQKELQKAKNHTLCFVYYIQNELGYKHLGLADDEFSTKDRLAYMPYHREGRRLKGVVTYTYNDAMKPDGQINPLYRTGISVGDYPVDHHHKCNPAVPGLSFLPVPSFSIPLGALIPEKVNGLVVADKAISVTNLINGSTRLQPVVLLTGQAAGVLAALSVKENKPVREVSVRQVQEELLHAKAYIMPLFDVKPDQPDFEAIQKISATGILKVKGEPFHWSNRTWFYPDSTITENEFCEGLKQWDHSLEISGNNNILTSGKFIELITPLVGKNIIQQSFPKEKELTKREIAILINKYLNPFDSKEVRLDGNWIQ